MAFSDELCGILLITGIVAGVVNGYGPSRIAVIFIDAWKDIVFEHVLWVFHAVF